MPKILIADDSPVEIKIIRRLLGNEYEIFEASNGSMALEIASELKPDLILLDIIMPGMDGLTVCKLLKSKADTADIPVVFITVISSSQEIVKGFEAGGQDYITKPFNSAELRARLKVHLELKKAQEAVLQYATQLEMKNQELRGLLVKLQAAAMTDYITGLPNRRSMMQLIKDEANANNKGKATLILADIDHFKEVNDTFGHDCGDSVLKRVADLMKEVLKDTGAIARWGGEEFLMLLPGMDSSAGRIIAEDIRRLIEKELFVYNDDVFSLTVTLGVADFEHDLGFDACIKKADEALYKGKTLSRNCVV